MPAWPMSGDGIIQHFPRGHLGFKERGCEGVSCTLGLARQACLLSPSLGEVGPESGRASQLGFFTSGPQLYDSTLS